MTTTISQDGRPVKLAELNGTTRYRTPRGRTVYVVTSGPIGGPYRPIGGRRDRVRVDYVGPDGAHIGTGWESAAALTVAHGEVS